MKITKGILKYMIDSRAVVIQALNKESLEVPKMKFHNDKQVMKNQIEINFIKHNLLK